MNIFRSLRTKLVLSFIFLILVICGSVFGYTLQIAKEALTDSLRDQLKSVALLTAKQIDGEKVTGLRVGFEDTPDFKEIRDKLLAIRKDNPSVKYSYIMRQDGDNVVFVVDDTYGIESDAAKIGEVYASNNPDTEDQDKAEILSGLQGPAAASRLYTDRWGTFLSGYAPIYNSDGKAVAVLGVDMTADTVLAKQNFIGKTIYIIIGLGILIGAILVGIISSSISRDIKKVKDMIDAMSRGQAAARDKELKQRKDEIGDIAKSVELAEGNIRMSMPGNFLDRH